MFCEVQLALLLAVTMVSPHVLGLTNERTSIERTYELTKYLEHQLKEIKDTYLSYLGPPFSDPDFSPPRPNSTALSLPSAATRLELWRGLENRARLAQNQRAYSVLLGAVRELARSTLCPYLQTSLLHFSTGLDGLLGSISGLMSTLGYSLPPPSSLSSSSSTPSSLSAVGAEARAQYPRRDPGGDQEHRPAPLMTQSLYKERGGTGSEEGGMSPGRHQGVGARVVRGEKEESGRRDSTERKKERERDRERGREGRRAEVSGGRSSGWTQEQRGERGRRGKKREPESWEGASDEEEEAEREGGTERWGRRRKLLSVSEDGDMTEKSISPESEPRVAVPFPETSSFTQLPRIHNQNDNNNNNNKNLYSYNLNFNPQYHTAAKEREAERPAGDRNTSPLSSSSSFPSLHPQRRSTRSLFSPTLHPPLSLFYPFGSGGEGHTLLSEPVPLSLRRGAPPALTPLLASLSSASSSPLLSVRPALNDFSRKVEGFWVLRELQSWLWRSAKDFNRLKKRLRV